MASSLYGLSHLLFPKPRLGAIWGHFGFVGCPFGVVWGVILVTLGFIFVTWGGPGHPLRARGGNFTDLGSIRGPFGVHLGVILESFREFVESKWEVRLQVSF